MLLAKRVFLILNSLIILTKFKKVWIKAKKALFRILSNKQRIKGILARGWDSRSLRNNLSKDKFLPEIRWGKKQ
jgi:hypothetical protein